MANPFRLKSILFLFVGLFIFSKIAHAQADQIERVWYNDEKTAKIQIYKGSNNKYYGKIIWLKEPTEDGKPKVDKKNPDKAKRDQPILNLVILKDFVKDGDHEYSQGTIYDPKKGSTYSCTMNYKGNELKVHGYIGISLIGRTSVWTKAD